MAATTQDRLTRQADAAIRAFSVKAGVKINAGTLVAIDTNDSNLAKPGATSTMLVCVGVSLEQADNTAGASGDIKVSARRDGAWCFANSASGDAITIADIGADCFIVDDQTVAKTNGSSTRSKAGKVHDVTPEGVWVVFA